jgi:DNA-binding MurR/RpiR family transcriptional regulator
MKKPINRAQFDTAKRIWNALMPESKGEVSMAVRTIAEVTRLSPLSVKRMRSHGFDYESYDAFRKEFAREQRERLARIASENEQTLPEEESVEIKSEVLSDTSILTELQEIKSLLKEVVEALNNPIQVTAHKPQKRTFKWNNG